MILLHLSVDEDLLVPVEANGCFDLCGAEGAFGPGAGAAEPKLFGKPLVEAGVITVPPWSATASKGAACSHSSLFMIKCTTW